MKSSGVDLQPIDPLRATPLVQPAVVGTLIAAVMALAISNRLAPPRTPAAADAVSPAGHLLIDINEADATMLGVLPGIGPTIAGRIIDHRQRHGRFANPDGLLKVHGIGPKTFDRISKHTVVLDPISAIPGGQTLAVDLP